MISLSLQQDWPLTRGILTLYHKEDLPRGIRAHEDAVLTVNCQPTRPETRVRTIPVVRVPHDGNFRVLAIGRLIGLSVRKFDSAKAITVRRAPVPALVSGCLLDRRCPVGLPAAMETNERGGPVVQELDIQRRRMSRERETRLLRIGHTPLVIVLPTGLFSSNLHLVSG